MVIPAGTVRVSFTASKDVDNIRGDIAIDDISITYRDDLVTLSPSQTPSSTPSPTPTPTPTPAPTPTPTPVTTTSTTASPSPVSTRSTTQGRGTYGHVLIGKV